MTPVDLWYMAHCDHLRNDDQGRSVRDITFEAKGYKPRSECPYYTEEYVQSMLLFLLLIA